MDHAIVDRGPRVVIAPRVERMRRVRPRDFVEVGAVMVTAARVELALRRRTLPATAQALGLAFSPSASGRAANAADETDSSGAGLRPLPAWATRRVSIAALVMRAWPFGDTCLRRALVTGSRLSSLAPELVIGVRGRSEPGGIDAHAWLRVDGIDLDPIASEYFAFGSP
jgi:hypothetical protein